MCKLACIIVLFDSGHWSYHISKSKHSSKNSSNHYEYRIIYNTTNLANYAIKIFATVLGIKESLISETYMDSGLAFGENRFWHHSHSTTLACVLKGSVQTSALILMWCMGLLASFLRFSFLFCNCAFQMRQCVLRWTKLY